MISPTTVLLRIPSPYSWFLSALHWCICDSLYDSVCYTSLLIRKETPCECLYMLLNVLQKATLVLLNIRRPITNDSFCYRWQVLRTMLTWVQMVFVLQKACRRSQENAWWLPLSCSWLLRLSSYFPFWNLGRNKHK